MRHILLKSIPDRDLAERWNTFLTGVRFATHYVTPNYFLDPYVSESGFAVIAIDEKDQIAAVATGTAAGRRIASGLFSRPQLVFGEKADRLAATQALMNGFEELDGSADLIELFAWEEMPEFALHDMQVRTSNEQTSIVMLDLSVGAEMIFRNFSQTRRNEIRKAIKLGVVEVKPLETDEELAEIYRIHCDWNERKGNIADSFEQMRTAAGQRANRRAFLAKVDGKVVAGSFYRFCPGGVVEYSSNFSMPEYQRLRPNDLIGWRAIEWACESGCAYFSMGGSHLFLRRFGGEVVRTFRYRRDQTRFRRYDLSENARDLGVEVFRRMPETFRKSVRKILAK